MIVENDTPAPPTAVVLTALKLECQAVLAHLSERSEHAVRGSIYELGWFVGATGAWRVAVAEIGPGNITAAAEAERAIGHFKPAVALFVGVAGACDDDVKLGDVVAAKQVYHYEHGRAGAEYKPRIKTYQSAYSLVQRARVLSHRDGWLDRMARPRASRTPQAHVGPIAAGEKVVADRRGAIFQLIKRYCGDSLAVEMEAAGFLLTAWTNPEVPALVVRGISDLVGGKSRAADKLWQPIAAAHAAAFAFELLSSYRPSAGAAAEVDGSAPQPIIVSLADHPAAGPAEAWRAGQEVDLEGDRYLVHDPVEETVEPDGSVAVQVATARLLPSDHRLVRLKQIRTLHETDAARERRRHLEDEAHLLRELQTDEHFPRLLRTYPDTGSLTIAHTMPEAATLREIYGPASVPGPPLEPFQLASLLRGMQPLCRTLGVLHRRRLAHRALSPDALLVGDDGQVRLRDLGLASTPARRGEGLADYRAPEQARPSRGREPGPHTDVYQLAAILYHVVTGHLPGSPGRPPPSAWNPDLPDAVDAVLLQALEPTPQRGTVRQLWERMRAAVQQVSTVPGGESRA